MKRLAFTVLLRLQTAAVRIVGSVIQLALSLQLAHVSGAAVLGRFLAFVAVANIFVAVAGGLPNLMLRHSSRDDDPQRSDYSGWLWRHSLELAAVGLTLSAVCALLGLELARDVALASSGLVVQRISSAALKAIGHPNPGILLDTALYPLVVMGYVLWAGGADRPVSDQELRSFCIGGIWLASLAAIALTWRRANSLRTSWLAPRRTPRSLYSEIAGVTLGAAAVAVSVNSPLALAPLFLTATETGNVGLALRVAGFASTILVSLIAYFGPAFARASSARKLRALLRQSQLASLALYLPIPLLVLALPKRWLLEVSPELVSVKALILILCVGYLVSAATGLASNLLIMLGLSRLFAMTTAGSALLTVLAVVGGAAGGGAGGLAVALSVVMSVTNLWVFWVATRAIRRVATEESDGAPLLSAAG